MALDPHLANVSLLLHCDGADGSSDFIDSSPTPKSIAVVQGVGSARISTAQSKFGGSCIRFSSGAITVPADESTAFGPGDFTIEFWVHATSGGYKVLFDQQINEYGTDAWRIYLDEGVPLWIDHNDGELFGSASVADGQWHHVAFVRAGGMLRLFVDGVFDTELLVASSYSEASAIGIGAPISYYYGPAYFAGYLDEIRITKGVARYTADFAPPTEPFPPSASLPDVNAYAAAPGLLGTPAALASVQPMAYASAPAALGSAQVLAMTTAYAFAASHSPLDAPAVVANFDDGRAASLGQSTQFGTPSLASVNRLQEGVQLLPFIPPFMALQGMAPGSVTAQASSLPGPVFGTPSVSFSTTHPAESIEPAAAFGVPVAQSIHAAQSLEPVVFGAIDAPAYRAQASSLSAGQTAFGQPVAATVHPVQDWYAGIRMGPLAASSFGSFPVLDSIQLGEFGTPSLGATSHAAMSLHLMPQFGPITISRGSMQC